MRVLRLIEEQFDKVSDQPGREKKGGSKALDINENLLDRVEKTGFTFMMTDIALALTMAHIAADSEHDSEKKARNQENARRAHDTILRIGSKAPLTEDERVELHDKLGELRSALEKLGEVF
ncbi:MAG TPA: hypothetical protein VJ731_07440 [Terriglobales bacterium]|nr:hypothetical protein [Terriglobales bacterium]